MASPSSLCVALILSLVCSSHSYRLPCDRKTHLLDIREDAQTTLTCDDINPLSDVTWRKFGAIGYGWHELGTCTPNSTCKVKDNGFFMTRTPTASTLVIFGRGHRERGMGEIQCHHGNNRALFDWCTMRSVYQARSPGNCEVKVDREKWTVSGSCDIDKIFSSDNEYSCTWHQVYLDKSEMVFPGTLNVAAFTDAETGQQYHQGRCVFTAPLVCLSGDFTYRISLSPGQQASYVTTLDIQYSEEEMSLCIEPAVKSSTSVSGADDVTHSHPSSPGERVTHNSRNDDVTENGTSDESRSSTFETCSRPGLTVFLWTSFCLLCVIIITVIVLAVRRQINKRRRAYGKRRRTAPPLEEWTATETLMNNRAVPRLPPTYLTPCRSSDIYSTIDEDTTEKEICTNRR